MNLAETLQICSVRQVLLDKQDGILFGKATCSFSLLEVHPRKRLFCVKSFKIRPFAWAQNTERELFHAACFYIKKPKGVHCLFLNEKKIWLQITAQFDLVSNDSDEVDNSAFISNSSSAGRNLPQSTAFATLTSPINLLQTHFNRCLHLDPTSKHSWTSPETWRRLNFRSTLVVKNGKLGVLYFEKKTIN